LVFFATLIWWFDFLADFFFLPKNKFTKKQHTNKNVQQREPSSFHPAAPINFPSDSTAAAQQKQVPSVSAPPSSTSSTPSRTNPAPHRGKLKHPDQAHPQDLSPFAATPRQSARSSSMNQKELVTPSFL